MKIAHLILFYILWSPYSSLLGMEWEMEASSSKPWYDSDFQEGLATLDNEIAFLLSDINSEKEYEEDYDEYTPLVTKSPNQSKSDTPISKETQELIINFLSLPDLAVEHTIPFLDNAALAYFIRLKYLSKNTVTQSLSKLDCYRVQCLIKGIKDQTLHKEQLTEYALQFGENNLSPYFQDLRSLHARQKKWLINQTEYLQLLEDYPDNSFDNAPSIIKNSIEKDDCYLLRRKLLKEVHRRITARKNRAQKCNNYLVTSRYCIPCEMTGISSCLCLIAFLKCIAVGTAGPQIMVPVVSAAAWSVATIGTLGCCCLLNVCYKTPELPCLQSWCDEFKGDTIFCTHTPRIALFDLNKFSTIMVKIREIKEKMNPLSQN